MIEVPAGSERSLRYSDWEYTRRQTVKERSAGKVGYMHLRAKGGSDINAWYRQFYPIFNRPGLIIDVRRNSGGNIDSIILEEIRRDPRTVPAPPGTRIVLSGIGGTATETVNDNLARFRASI